MTSVNQQPIGGGSPGPIAKSFIRAWSESVGIDIEEQAMIFAAGMHDTGEDTEKEKNVANEG